MKTYFISLMLISLLTIGVNNELEAQDKFEYASVIYLTRLGKPSLQFTSQDGTKRFPIESYEDAALAIINKVNDLSNLGWEVYNNSEYNGNADTYSLTYFLRRKKLP